MARRKPSLLHRGYLYAQKRVHLHPTILSDLRMDHAKSWRDGYLAAQRDARKHVSLAVRSLPEWNSNK